MRYIDSGSRDVDHALGTWLKELCPDQVAEVRFQSGFFGAGGLALMKPTLDAVVARSGVIRALIGSNDSETVEKDVIALFHALGMPRERAELGVVAFASGYFHPKVLHLIRRDGTQTAYVGSANLTRSGVHSLHVEAGIIVDTRHGDQTDSLEEIRDAIDYWFEEEPPGFFRIGDAGDIQNLVRDGTLSTEKLPVAKNSSGGGAGSRLPVLRPLIPIATSGGHRIDAETGEHVDGKGAVFDSEVGASTEGTATSDRSASTWQLVWRSKDLVRRDLTIPTGKNTNPTGSMLMKKGDWDDIDQRHYFRDEVFAGLPWASTGGYSEGVSATFEIVVRGIAEGSFNLHIHHNTNTESISYEQKNSMTSLRWGAARPHVAKENLLGCRMYLYRQATPHGSLRFKIEIDD